MDSKEQEFLKRLQAIFRTEAEEHLNVLTAGFMELEKTTEAARRAEIVESVFREAHSLKGAARSVNLKDVESICQPLESTLSALKRDEISLSPELFDLLHQAVDTLAQIVSSPDVDRNADDRTRVRDLNRRLVAAARGAGPPSGETEESMPGAKTPALENGLPAGLETRLAVAETFSTPVTRTPLLEAAAQPSALDNPVALRTAFEGGPIAVETVRIPITKLDPLLLQAEEMIQAKIAAGQRVADMLEIQQSLFALKTEAIQWKDQGIAESHGLPELISARLAALTDQVTTVSQVFAQDQRALRTMVDDHLATMKQVLLLPVSTLVAAFPRLVRDLARGQGKEVDLIIRGAEIEVEKRILEDLKDPLIHLLRNCVDHGIEKPEERARAQKPARGTITLAFGTKDSREVEILVADDGAGIDVERIRQAAVRAGVIPAEDTGQLTPQEIVQLIFQSGVSTSEIITDISGRGLGLAIVREKTEKLGGSVSVETRTGAGTTFKLRMPLTLATFHGVLVRAGEQVFVLPTAHIERALRVSREEIGTVENRETIRLDGRVLSLVRLGDVLELPVQRDNRRRQQSATALTATDHSPVLVLASAEKRIAMQVDEVLAEEEVLVKGLGKQLSRVRNIAGATVLGTGQVVPVLNVPDLLKSAVRSVSASKVPAAVEKTTVPTSHLLVAEDSITARTLLKSILETAGYRVTTAVDGADAFTQLRSGEFDLVVSDVDMPRMSGFELTTRIREDEKLSELPVVLVTALESRQDRERGIEVGANAYIIKSSFDQSNLLEVIQRFL